MFQPRMSIILIDYAAKLFGAILLNATTKKLFLSQLSQLNTIPIHFENAILARSNVSNLLRYSVSFTILF